MVNYLIVLSKILALHKGQLSALRSLPFIKIVEPIISRAENISIGAAVCNCNHETDTMM